MSSPLICHIILCMCKLNKEFNPLKTVLFLHRAFEEKNFRKLEVSNIFLKIGARNYEIIFFYL